MFVHSIGAARKAEEIRARKEALEAEAARVAAQREEQRLKDEKRSGAITQRMQQRDARDSEYAAAVRYVHVCVLSFVLLSCEEICSLSFR